MRSRWLYAGALAWLALNGGTAWAQGRGRGHDKDRGGRGRGDQGENRGQEKKEEREGALLGARERVYADNWYYHNRRNLPPGLRDRDRLPPGIERRFAPGYVIAPSWRARVYPAPVVLVRTFPPPPPDCRYVMFGGRIVLVDAGYRVRDFITFDINLGP